MANQEHKCFQIYFINDHKLEAKLHRNNDPENDSPSVMQLQQMLHTHNHYVKDFTTFLEKMPTDEHKLVIHANRTPVGVQHERRCNVAEVINEMAIIIVGN